nr:putative UDP-glucose 4-epimerase [uncultured Mediterranean phage uvMED]
MQVLVTGGVGFIGSNLIEKLYKQGHEVISVDNYSTGKKENEHSFCEYHNVDLQEHPLEYVKMEKPDIIYHLAAKARILPSIQNPLHTMKNNVDSMIHVLDYARSKNVPVVYAGSSSVVGDIYSNPYTLSKFYGEELCKMYSEVYDTPISICRFYNVYGKYQLTEGAYCTLIGIFERLYNNNQPLTITGDGEQRRDFTHVDDIVDGLIRCGKGLNSSGDRVVITGKTFELGRGKNYSINEIADTFGDYPREYIDGRSGEMRETLNTDTMAKDMLGWNPKGDVIDYIKNNILKK